MPSFLLIASAMAAFGLCGAAVAVPGGASPAGSSGEPIIGRMLDPGQDGKRGSVPDKTKNATKKSQEKGRSGPLRFIWPTLGRKIVEGYGEKTNPNTGIVMVNPGINIAARKGSAALASEEGRVSLVSWLPGYSTIVIVQHRGGYRTVYGNLAAAAVTRGAAIRSGAKIGTVGGTYLHFEVWRDQTRLDPTSVLR
jgi:murein DD-endopeptidase MepM/ murein hydrolase activator NlpD